MATWRDMNPAWDYMLWTEANLPKLSTRRHFQRMKQLPGKADILRYEVLRQFGGFFIDADSESLKPLPDFLLDNDSFACFENEKLRGDMIANGYLGAAQGNALMAELCRRIRRMWRVNHKDAWLVTGPALLTTTVRQMKYSKLTLYPSHFFMPEHYTGHEYQGSDEMVFGRQYWGSTVGYAKVPA